MRFFILAFFFATSAFAQGYQPQFGSANFSGSGSFGGGTCTISAAGALNCHMNISTDASLMCGPGQHIFDRGDISNDGNGGTCTNAGAVCMNDAQGYDLFNPNTGKTMFRCDPSAGVNGYCFMNSSPAQGFYDSYCDSTADAGGTVRCNSQSGRFNIIAGGASTIVIDAFANADAGIQCAPAAPDALCPAVACVGSGVAGTAGDGGFVATCTNGATTATTLPVVFRILNPPM